MPRVAEQDLESAEEDRYADGTGVFRLLETEHTHIDALMRRVATASGPARRALFGELARELKAEVRAKEHALYPSLRQLEEAAELVDESIEDHAAMAALIDRLDSSTVERLGEIREVLVRLQLGASYVGRSRSSRDAWL